MSNGKFINLWVGQEAPPNISDLWLYPGNGSYKFRTFNRNTGTWDVSTPATVSAAENGPAIGKVLLNTGQSISPGTAATFLDYCKERNLGVEAVGIITGTSLPSVTGFSSGLSNKGDIGDSIVASNGKGYFAYVPYITLSDPSQPKSKFYSLLNQILTTLVDYPEISSEVSTPCELDSNTLLCLSGTSPTLGWDGASNKSYKYNIISNSFTEGASNSLNSIFKRSALLGSTLYVVGFKSMQKYSLTLGTWTTVPSGPLLGSLNDDVRLCIEVNSKILVGVPAENWELYQFDASSNSWSYIKILASLYTPIGGAHGVTFNGKKYFAGGYRVQLKELLEDFSLADIISTDIEQGSTPLIFSDHIDMIAPNETKDNSCKITPGSYTIEPYNPET